MPDIPPETEVSKGIKLRFVELSNFRRLGKVQLNIDEKTTILVGANNSGKHLFLRRYDISLQMGLPLVLSTSVFPNGQSCEPLAKFGKNGLKTL